jgi:hypothetical protein
LILTLDERFFALWKLWRERDKLLLAQTTKGVFQIDNYGVVLWHEPPSSPLSRRSIFNPSIIFDRQRDRWIVASRFTRGRRTGQCLLQYLADDDDVMIRGEPFRASILISVFDNSFSRKIEEFPVYVKRYGETIDPLFWQGEDPRIFVEAGELLIQSTLHSPHGRRLLAHGKLETVEGSKVIYVPSRIIRSENDEKNWSAISTREGLFLTHVHPRWKVARLSPGNGTPEFVLDEEAPEILHGLRCTSGCKPFGKTTLITCLHSTHPYRTYLCELDSTSLLPLRLSQPLEFGSGLNYIEFPSGLEVRGNDVYFGVGINDIEYKIFKTPREVIDILLTVDLTVL